MRVPKLRKYLYALLGSLLFLYPKYFFILDSSDRISSAKPWADQFQRWCRWDCQHFADVSTSYTHDHSAFFPAFPLIAHAVRLIVPALTAFAGVILVSNLLTWIFQSVVLQLGSELWPKAPRLGNTGWSKRAWLLGLAFALFPFGQFWLHGYSEPLFALTFAVTLIFLAQKRWPQALIAAGIGAVCRVQGIWVFGVVLAFLVHAEWSRKRVSPRFLLSVLLASLPLLAFMAWETYHTGNPLYFLELHRSGWGRKFDPLQGLLSHVPSNNATYGLLLLSLWASYVFIKRSELHWRVLGVCTLLLAEIPLFVGGYYSYARFTSVNLGIFALLVELVELRPGWTLAMILWAVTRLSVEIFNWFKGHWSG